MGRFGIWASGVHLWRNWPMVLEPGNTWAVGTPFAATVSLVIDFVIWEEAI